MRSTGAQSDKGITIHVGSFNQAPKHKDIMLMI